MGQAVPSSGQAAFPSTALTGIVVVLVLGLLLASGVLLIYALRQARRTGATEGPGDWQAPSWELLWIVVPLIVVAALLALSLRR